jgi:hypothetical protein
MTTEINKIERDPRLPQRHPQRDFFVCDIFDAAPKSDIASMEHPLFTLSTKPDMNPRHYSNNNGDWVELNPSYLGLATVFDRDILIYCISQCMSALNEGREVHRTLQFSAHDLLKATNRDTSDKGYIGFASALERLRSTSIKTNIKMGGEEALSGFGFIDKYEVVRKTRDGRMQGVEITLSDWIFSAINAKGKDILTISRDYFRLRKPLERRLYELARKCCGQNKKWHFRVKTLHERTGSTSTLKEFRRMLKNIIETNTKHQHIPDYTFELKDDLVIMRPRSGFTDVYDDTPTLSLDSIQLRPSTYEVIRKYSGGYDVHGFLVPEWKEMLAIKKSIPTNPDGSFIAYVKWYVGKHGAA